MDALTFKEQIYMALVHAGIPAATTVLGSLLVYFGMKKKQKDNHDEIKKDVATIHIEINSRMHEYHKLIKKNAYEEGFKAGQITPV